MLCLRDDVEDLLEVKNIEECPTEEQEARIIREMERLVDRHNEVAELTDRLSGVMVEITLGHFVTSSLIIGTSVVDLLLVSRLIFIPKNVYHSHNIFPIVLWSWHYCVCDLHLGRGRRNLSILSGRHAPHGSGIL